MVDYKIEDIYQGGYNSLNPPESDVFSGYRVSAGDFGMTTDPRVGNVLGEASTKLNAGLKQIELSLITPQIFDAIPKQQLEEINRLSKLTGVDVSVHGPLIESSGISSQSGGFDEMRRKGTERQITFAVERAHEASPDSDLPVTFHSTVEAPSSLYRKDDEGKVMHEVMPVINQETGELTRVKRHERAYPYPSEDGKVIMKTLNVNELLDSRNKVEWDNSLTQLIAVKERADRVVNETFVFVQPIVAESRRTGVPVSDLLRESEHIEQVQRYGNAQAELKDVQLNLDSLFDKAYRYGNEEQKNYLKILAGNFQRQVSDEGDGYNLKTFSSAMQGFMEGLRDSRIAPDIYKSAEEFAIEKSGETFGNAAFNVYRKAQEEGWKGTPVISIENPPAGTTGLNRGEDLKRLVEASQKKFVDRAVNEGSMSREDARAQAEKLIGATWDVGHINMLKKYGFSDEDILKETEHVKPHLKHVHLSDNFGYEHTELPMGMGNVPLNQIMERLGEKGFEAKKVIEAADWWNHFKTSPFQETLEAFGSPVYSMKMAPYWSQSLGFQQGYFSGYGETLPQINYETFGGGFSQLPTDLGGQRAGGRGGRMSDRPME